MKAKRMNSQKWAFTQSNGTRLVMTVPPQTIRMMRTIMRCGVVAAWLSARMPGTVLPLVGSAAVTAVNAAADSGKKC